jgi:hypothetical protein
MPTTPSVAMEGSSAESRVSSRRRYRAASLESRRASGSRTSRFFEPIITLWTGTVGDEGWFAVETIPQNWATAGPTADGLRNFVGPVVGPGLGGGKNNRETHLDKIPNVTPLRATGLKMLEGSCICAVVYDSDISINYDPLNGSLKGANLGIVAFEVLDVTQLTGQSSGSLPKVEIRILDADQVCAGPLTLFDAPAPISSSIPHDVIP